MQNNRLAIGRACACVSQTTAIGDGGRRPVTLRVVEKAIACPRRRRDSRLAHRSASNEPRSSIYGPMTSDSSFLAGRALTNADHLTSVSYVDRHVGFCIEISFYLDGASLPGSACVQVAYANA
jgi:hypothetical protein